MSTTSLPGATWRPVSYRGSAGSFAAAPLGWILHVTVSNGSPFNVFEGAVSPNRRFSHGWVAKDGHSEQYTQLTEKSWAAMNGNESYVHFETEGYPNEPLTSAQIHTLALWHNHLGSADSLAAAPGQRGVGTHFMGGAAWGGHTCPDSTPGAGPRSRQRQAIIDTARVLRGQPPIPPIHPPNSKHSVALTKAVQVDVHVGPDGVWGVVTQAAATAVIVCDLNHVQYLQARVGAYPDGIWGPLSVACRIATIKKLQANLGVAPDGAWGPISSAAWARAVANNYMH